MLMGGRRKGYGAVVKRALLVHSHAEHVGESMVDFGEAAAYGDDVRHVHGQSRTRPRVAIERKKETADVPVRLGLRFWAAVFAPGMDNSRSDSDTHTG